MKNLLIACCIGLSTLAIDLNPIYSQSIDTEEQNIVEVTPFNLVFHGYQGSLKDRGIPSYGAFLHAIRLGRIKAIDLIRAGIEEGRLSADRIDDKNYINRVQMRLNSMIRH